MHLSSDIVITFNFELGFGLEIGFDFKIRTFIYAFL